MFHALCAQRRRGDAGETTFACVVSFCKHGIVLRLFFATSFAFTFLVIWWVFVLFIFSDRSSVGAVARWTFREWWQ